MVDYLQSTNPAVGTERVMVPGEPEIAAMETRRAEGIPIDDNTWAAILKSAEVAGMTDSEVDDLIS